MMLDARTIRAWGAPWVCGAAAAMAVAQTPAPSQHLEATQAQAAQARPASADEWLARARQAYRQGPLVERLMLHAGEGRSRRTSVVWLRLDAGDPQRALPPRLRWDAPSLTISAQGESVVAILPSNATQAYVCERPGGLSMTLLEACLPELPVPQIRLMLGDERREGASAGVWALWDVDALAWEVVPAATPGMVILRATGPRDASADAERWISRTITLDEQTGRVLRFEASGSAGTIIAGTVDQRPDEEAQGEWMIRTSDRDRLETLSKLAPTPARVGVGQRVDAVIGLASLQADGTLTNWDLSTRLADVEALPPQPPGKVASVLVLVSDASPANARLAALAQDACRELLRDLDIERMQPRAGTPRAVCVLAACLELSALRSDPNWVRDQAAQHARWGVETQDARVPLVWCQSGADLLAQTAPGSSVAIVVLDASQSVLGVLTLDQRMVDAQGLAAQVREFLRDPVIDGR